MGEIKRDSTQFAGFEYKEISAAGETASFCLDCYPSFGWTLDERTQSADGKVVLRRERKIMNKAELTRLQRHFEACVEELEALECSKTAKATIVSLITGLIGCAFMAGSVFAVTHEPPLILLCVVLAIPGFTGWLLPWFVYKKMVRRRTKLVNELKERKYDEIYEICEKGSQLLNP